VGELVDVRFAVCAAISVYCKAGYPGKSYVSMTDNIKLWQIPLCRACTLIAYVEVARRQLRILGITLASFVGVLLLDIVLRIITSWRAYFPFPEAVLLVAVLWMSIVWIQKSKQRKILELNGLATHEHLELAFRGEGKRIISSVASSDPKASEKVWGDFLMPEYKIRPQWMLNQMVQLRASVALPGGVDLSSKRRVITTVGATLQEIEQLLTGDSKPLWEAMKAEHPELVFLTNSDTNGGTEDLVMLLHHAAYLNLRDDAQSLLDDHADVAAKCSGWTPLHLAACANSKDVAGLLLANGATVDADSDHGYRPLRYAVIDGHREMAEVLLACKADVNDRSNNGETSLHAAAARGYKEIAELLLAYGADVNAKANDGSTPLHCAAFKGNRDVAELLVTNNAEVNTSGKNGGTPLHMATVHGHKEVVEVLLANKADVNAKCSGWTALSIAASEGHMEVAKLLLASRADVNARDNGGKTALYWPAMKSNKPMVYLLRQHGGRE
jgi:ankyrin repeat protein